MYVCMYVCMYACIDRVCVVFHTRYPAFDDAIRDLDDAARISGMFHGHHLMKTEHAHHDAQHR